MKINYIYIILVFLLFGKNIFAQQDPSYIFYRYNMNFVNPAYAGAENTTEFSGNIRSQWSGVMGAPETQSFMFSTPVGGNVGLGLSVINDKTFIEKLTSIAIDFSYKVQWDEYSNIYFGLKASANSYKANTEGLTTYSFQSDPSLMNIDGGLTPNIGAGVYFKNRKLSISFSVPKILKPNRLERDGSLAKLGRNKLHMYLMAAYDIRINQNLILKPSTMLRYVEDSPVSVDITTGLKFKDIIELGAAYRINEGAAGYVLFDFAKNLNIGYAYESSNGSSLDNVNNGTHEVFLKFRL